MVNVAAFEPWWEPDRREESHALLRRVGGIQRDNKIGLAHFSIGTKRFVIRVR
jgi:hypothetical protein